MEKNVLQNQKLICTKTDLKTILIDESIYQTICLNPFGNQYPFESKRELIKNLSLLHDHFLVSFRDFILYVYEIPPGKLDSFLIRYESVSRKTETSRKMIGGRV